MRSMERQMCARRDGDQAGVLGYMLERCEAVAATLDAGGTLDAQDVTGSLGEMSTMLVAVAVDMERDLPGIARGFGSLARRCQRAARPFIVAPDQAVGPGHDARSEAREVTADVVSTLRHLTGRTG